ncbi:FAD:protein FMN transferase [Marimonas arenosa]|uniref:FAD:protein FMN transferase n=1 Tax=Marimonas arenosa TaxID=1795305 RepID=A0AAE3WHH7_9RHOB|nr:FAD:protein FMN transferase [Marimonas arenosa]MDQ2091780.1 FAD:protein FMN transferase [Marimonas arenosa]
MMLTRRRFLTIAAASVACPAGATPSEWRGRALGADVTLRLAGAADPAGRIWRKVANALRQIEARFSLFADSELTRLNAHGRLGSPSPETQALIRLAGEVHHATHGVFDPTVQPLWRAIAQGEDPSNARSLAGWDKLRLSEREISLGPGMALTFNGIAQGFAADTLAALMLAHGFTDVLIDAGEIQAVGRHGRDDWQVGMSSPEGNILRRVALRDRALATSSPAGTRIGSGMPHILHPDGRPVIWQTVSVSASSAALADALSTAFCLMRQPEIESALAHFPDARVEYLG